MPTYDYRCSDCGYVFEEFQSISAPPLEQCPSCGRPALKRLLAGGAGMIFKGSGFYLTDYRKNAAETKAPGGTSEPPAEGSPSPSKKPDSATNSPKASGSGNSES